MAVNRAPALARAADRRRRRRPGIGPAGLLTLVAVQVGLAFGVSRAGLFKPGDDVGYNLGLAGGIMMLVLLLYPLRKHLRRLEWFGAIRSWFMVHMICGIVGPTLILTHSTFRIGSFNAGVALVSMLLVAGSGIIGRFIYVHIHHGLYGEKASLRELQAMLGFDEAAVKSKFHLVAPGVEKRLLAFEEYALRPGPSAWHRLWRFVTLAEYAWFSYVAASHELREAYQARAAARGWDKQKLERRVGMARAVVSRYLRHVRSVAQFSTYERLFSLWHILHVPLVYMLALSAIAHVVAVHMY